MSGYREPSTYSYRPKTARYVKKNQHFCPYQCPDLFMHILCHDGAHQVGRTGEAMRCITLVSLSELLLDPDEVFGCFFEEWLPFYRFGQVITGPQP